MSEILVVRYDNGYKEKWNDFVEKAKNGLFMHNRNYMDYHNDRFADHSLIFLEDEKIIALLPANEKDKALISHGGLTYGGLIIGNSIKQHTVNDCFESLMEYTKKNEIQEVIYKPIPHVLHRQPAEEDIYSIHRCGGKIVEVSASTVLDLRNPLKMPKGRKAQISRAKREGVLVEILFGKEDYKNFITLENQVLEQRHGVRAVHTAEEIYLLHSRFPKNIHLYGATYDDEMIAGSIIFEYEEAVHTQYMASSEKGRELGALDLVIFNIINDYKGTKKWLDFGISTEDHGKIMNEGLISQKEGFGGRTNVYTTWNISE